MGTSRLDGPNGAGAFPPEKGRLGSTSGRIRRGEVTAGRIRLIAEPVPPIPPTNSFPLDSTHCRGTVKLNKSAFFTVPKL
jgi:hypothetical protein